MKEKEINDVSLDVLTNVTHELLFQINEVQYYITHFIKKTNKSTALDVRNSMRDITKLHKNFKDATIKYFEKEQLK